MTRRSLLVLGAAAMALPVGAVTQSADFEPSRIRAVAFDAFAIFDLGPLWSACERKFPGRGAALGVLWRARQFEYQWLCALAGKYQDFWQTTRDALNFAARATGLKLTNSTRDFLMGTYLHMSAWPDVARVLAQLRASGRKLLLLSNATEAVLESSLQDAQLHAAFDHILSTDRIASFKPDPRAYQLAVDCLGYGREEILFVAFAGWDAAGARWFGYPTFWNNRLSLPLEELGVSANATGASLQDLAGLLHLEAFP